MAIKANPPHGVDTLMKFYTNMAVTACYLGDSIKAAELIGRPRR